MNITFWPHKIHFCREMSQFPEANATVGTSIKEKFASVSEWAKLKVPSFPGVYI